LLFHTLDLIESRRDDEWNVGTLLESVHECLSIESDQWLRIVMIYGRSNCIPECSQQEMQEFYQRFPHCCFDIVYLHDKPSEENKVQEIFDTLGYMESETSRSFEITRNYKRYLLAMTELLGNPSHRSVKPKCHYWDF
jgi:hypothetical protein